MASGSGRSQIGCRAATAHFCRSPRNPSAEIFRVVDLNDDGQLDWWGFEWPGGSLDRARHKGLSLAGNPSARPGDRWRPADQLVRHRRRDRNPIRTAHRETVDRRELGDFGLGTHTGIDVARIVWPKASRRPISIEAQSSGGRGAAPEGFVSVGFADNGSRMRFVTDFLWRSPLGLRINAQDTAGVSQTEDWVRIRGDQLVARDGSSECGSPRNCGRRISSITSR